MRIWRRVAPSVRSVANSRVRWAIVIDSVFAITKLPTKSAMKAKASRKYRMKLVNPLTLFLSSFTWAETLRTCAEAGNRGLISSISFDVGTPAFDCTRIRSSFPTRPRSFCSVGRSNTERVALPIETPDSFTIPATRNFWMGPFRSTPIVSPTCVALARRDVGVDRDLV